MPPSQVERWDAGLYPFPGEVLDCHGAYDFVNRSQYKSEKKYFAGSNAKTFHTEEPASVLTLAFVAFNDSDGDRGFEVEVTPITKAEAQIIKGHLLDWVM